MKIRIVKNYKQYAKGEIADLEAEQAVKLIERGYAKIDRMVAEADFHVARGDRISERRHGTTS